ncbi:MAG TPA: BREX-1 system phosphatase PglZ type B [Solirubrobacteraceae bacterium]|jgi:hypothetical protein|nr:BREX-1 system phosphatase PglZ type B [Solirubrobacteraceae bacterium]
MSDTGLDRLVSRLTEALAYNANAEVEPIALLWPDSGRQWESILARIGERLPLVSLGDYAPDERRGPAYWVRCVVAGTVQAGLPEGTRIVYLPGVARGELRAIDTCSAELAPIAELQYRGQWFSSPNGKDWTVRALLGHAEHGLGLRVAEDADTAAMLPRALSLLVDLPVDRLATQLLDADFLRDLINPDPVKRLLDWIDDPEGFRPGVDEAQWLAFVQKCRADYGFDPGTEGAITAAERLGGRKGRWEQVWMRFAEAPERYPGIPERLRQAKPLEFFPGQSDTTPGPSETWPQDNEDGELQLRALISGIAELTPEQARGETERLDAEHAWRRGTVWADLDRSPLAFAIEQLAHLAELAARPLSARDLVSLTADYAERGWRADDALLRALAAAKHPADRGAVSAAAAALYWPWLQAGAAALQAVIGPMAEDHAYRPGLPGSTAAGTVSVFVDGLRLDIAHRVQARLLDAGLQIDLRTCLAALPTVTSTAKPALVPVSSGALIADGDQDLYAANAATRTKATAGVLRTLMSDNGVQVLDGAATGDPAGTAWTEASSVDRLGHEQRIGLVDHVDEEVERIVARIRELLDAGWTRVELLSDHGWILLPGGMEKVELPAATTVVKKGRCARLKDGAEVSVPTVPWFWEADVRIAIAPGATCFEANKEYEHGGVSPQECIVPRLTVTAGATVRATGGPEITGIKWLGLLCRVELTGVGSNALVDLRGLPADPSTSIAKAAKEACDAGRVSLIVPDDEHEGERAHLVVVAERGQILAQREVVVGRNR